jgi:folate-binding protein YgfZ
LDRGYLASSGARIEEIRGAAVVADFGDKRNEYAAALAKAGLYPALDRGLIEVAGRDRTSWLHNLTTNAVRDLLPGDGNYTFAVNLKGRILLDFNVLVLSDSIRLDMDRRSVPEALKHFNRYIITEDVTTGDLSERTTRFVLLGPMASQVARLIGVPHASSMAQLGSITVDLLGQPALLFRHDLAGVFGLEITIPNEAAADVWSHLLEIGRSAGLRPVGRSAVRTLQIEAGIPVWGEEIDGEVLPAETLQLDRAVSFNKGCYLGHEVIERMRSHQAIPRRLVGLRMEQPPACRTPPVALQAEGKAVGRLMSCCESPAVGSVIGLGYLASAYAQPGAAVTLATDPPIEAQVISVPLRPDAD